MNMGGEHPESYEALTLEQLIDDGIAGDGVDDAIYDLEIELRGATTLAEFRGRCLRGRISVTGLDEKLAGRARYLAERPGRAWSGLARLGE
ncbi:hypothetical protein LJB86_01885 [Deltaproteobacteria bacterium OttesenSCG-928-M10]|nr:hypothetical protein [Deltaproteobacteria bacterium OttesenSCG-928-M10]